MTATHVYDCDPYAEEGMPVEPPDRRPLHLIAADALAAQRIVCWPAPGEPCDAGGMHLCRLARARRHGEISGPDMAVVLDAAGARFESATVIAVPVLAGAAA